MTGGLLILAYDQEDQAAWRSLWVAPTGRQGEIFAPPSIGGDDPGRRCDGRLAPADPELGVKGMEDAGTGEVPSPGASTGRTRRIVRVAVGLFLGLVSCVAVLASAWLANIAATGCFWSCAQDPDPAAAAASFLAFASGFAALAAGSLTWGVTTSRGRDVALRVMLPALGVAAVVSTLIVVSI